jgi:hypothetical protein
MNGADATRFATAARVATTACFFLAASTLCAAAQAQEAAPVLFEPGLISTGYDESHIAFAPDGRSLYVLRNSPDFMHWTVLLSERRGSRWSPLRLATFSGRWSDADVFITRDQRLYFVSNRPRDGVVHDDTDIWTMRREGDHWGEPERVAELSSEGYEWFPTMTDGGVIYFGSERQGGAGRSDLWRARWLGDHFSEPENLGPALNTANQEIEPLIAPDESWLVFAAQGRTPSAGAYDLYVSYNCPGGWTPPRPLGHGVNSDGWDFAPRMSPDGRQFFFTSNRSMTAGEWKDVRSAGDLHRRLETPGNGLRDIYVISAQALRLERRC